MSIIMTGGGTGGHLAIIKAVKEQLKGEELIYIGSTTGQDRQWFENDEDFTETYFFDTRGVVNQRGFGKLKSLWMMLQAMMKARKLLKKYDAKVVFSVGGFSSAATAFAAKSASVPLVIHEQNAALGSLNKLLRPYAAAFISSYLEESPIKAYPIKEVFFDNVRVRKNVETIIFLGGSQGAKAINKLALEIAPKLKERGIRIIHQAGEKNIDEVRKDYEDIGIEAEVFGFTTKLADYMKEADLAIARAGASTLWELSATALPTLFIPYPYAVSDHQYYNAQFLVEKDLAWIMREGEIDTQKVLALLGEDLETKSRGLMEIVEKDGSKQIADLLKNYAKS
ncbi:undecaprenyldiphospho-muramoylpentapeptide beta-N-acetylglucosaminyltransferase [Sulfurovum sp. NBC37-1]|uniref:UDP-N-acetylglucosamine--N-acetylmuramyl-(pentapeptide) pyrophosphoryl-undecaprenol N-acetylglucosamine transferase n=1 Tax=Sulfurovum sp. (strain NBC37-1) TaxID=387093 RepID=MURG_SULNB|nr:undecaprenyldiphospho-muramoylpentapeptide beta-N-acetylglucosaminyltransferase [Sulfurovum sp. NBC37-1]A6Q722.1 RecName: Full=UDP-N-acetylglucosamine--N-acetylmuramyl-(pentapeptide) pyrophosphoryl-undecaprenol N-acetylglucosamine transferase; AltName: Full=Undecaprenyl-PP-MurNAc-pentapeptide-UDPGlcNAc GlcNAc transferase [Sulfurovum sp. NBC37-1]BAF71281.1 undecaprenyldiphospho-muramoylpentapeptide beta-N- acetylglucosaminyltransferase [Sulfurovum sp. NBC37-1]